MNTVMKDFKVGARCATKGDVGIEVEVEGENLPRPTRLWRIEHDGSLRGEALEYVLRKPMAIKDACKALDYLGKQYEDNNTIVHDSVRAGVHVHINVQELTTVQLFTFITSYIILEDLLVKYCGEYREGNLFCLRMRDADFLLYMLEQTANNKRFNDLHTDILRYASMNVKSLHQYGSLEFRAMRGTRDLDVIATWAKLLLNLRNQAVKFENAADLYRFISEKGTESFLELFLGDLIGEVCNTPVGDIDLSEGLLRAHPLAMKTNWETFKTVSIGGLEFPLGTEFPDAPMEDW